MPACPGSLLTGRGRPAPGAAQVFHVPQARHYCAGEWEVWDSKITTFPGIYVAAAVAGRALAPLGFEACSLAQLRALGVVFLAGSCALLAGVLRELHGPAAAPAGATALQALALSLFPLHLFYAHLYYTDVPAVFFLLLCYYLCLRGRGWASALAGAGAVLMRQTNAVWVVFVLCVGVHRTLRPAGGGHKREPPPRALPGGFPEARDLLRAAWARRGDLVRRFGALALVPAGFALFVVRNGGVAVGDKDAHRPVLHFAQLLYFCSCSLGFLAPLLPDPLLNTLRAAAAAPRGRSVLAAGALCTACLLAAHRSTLVHPYILADNRHSTFYLWRHLLGRGPWVRYALVPGHALAAAAVGRWASAEAPPLVALAWALATAATLVPAHLVELRYFNVPFLLLCAHGPPWAPAQSARAALAFLGAHLAALYVFLERPFRWPDGSTARFMW